MKVLVIEDEHKIAAAIKKGLEQESYTVDVTYDGQEGFDLATTEFYNVIILDIMLPKIDGLTLCRNLRTSDVHTPVLILTAKGELDDRVSGLNAGADDYLVKPFAFAELIARVKALSRRPRKTVSAILEVNDLVLDTVSFAVTRNHKEIKLSRKEFVLLEYLMRHPGQILSKDKIIQNVWNYEADILPNTVEVYIGYLRQKIDKAFPKRPPLIQTIRGFGYQLGDRKNTHKTP